MTTQGTKGCLDRIQEVYNALNGAEKKVAQYILENPKNIIHFSITELAEYSDVSETTVFRLCNRLGYKGYQELKIKLAGSIVEPVENIFEDIKENDDAYMIMHKMMNSNIYCIEKTMKKNDHKKLEEAVELILNSGQIMFFGMGGSGAIADDAYHKFVRTGLKCSVSTDSHWQAMFASMAKEKDVIIAISNSGSNKELIESIEIGKANGVKVIAITSNGKSPIAKVSDVTLVSYGTESTLRTEAMESRISSLVLLDSLYVTLALKRKEETLKNLESIRNGIAVKRY